MAFFTSGRRDAGAEVAPISRDRIVAALESQQWRHFIDDDGDVGGFWDESPFYFMLRGTNKEILVVNARWNISVDAARLEEVRVLIDDWNREHWWPKMYRGMNDEGRVQVYSEYPVDLELGVTDAQLLHHLRCAIGTSAQAFSHFRDVLGL